MAKKSGKTIEKEVLKNLIDFVVMLWVDGANPNGDPAEGNRPRTDIDGYGVMSDVCIKRKLRNAVQELGFPIFMQADDRCIDGYNSVESRAKGYKYIDCADENEAKRKLCEDWYDVRAFGQVFAFGKTSMRVDGPVTIQRAKTVDTVEIEQYTITKSLNGTEKAGLSSDRIGQKYYVKSGLYVVKGSISPRLAGKNGFTKADAEILKKAILTMFDNDESAARPRGSMVVEKLYWWEHNGSAGVYKTKEIYKAIHIEHKDGCDNPSSIDDYVITVDALDNVKLSEYESIDDLE